MLKINSIEALSCNILSFPDDAVYKVFKITLKASLEQFIYSSIYHEVATGQHQT